MINPEKTSNRVINLRKRLGLNQTEFAKRLGVTGNYLSMIEGGREPSATLLELIRLMEKDAAAQASAGGGARALLKREREAKGLSQAELAKAANYSLATYQDIEEGRSNMGEKQAKKVAKILGIDASLLMDGSDEPVSRDVPFGTVGAIPDIGMGPGMENVKVRFVPVLSWAQCGKMETAFDDGAYTHMGFITFDAEDRKAFAVQLTGDSMSPIYGPGDTAIVYPSFPARNGDLVIAKLNEEAGGDVMFKIYQGNSAEVTLTSYNPAHAPMKFPRQQFTWIYPVDSVNKKLRRQS